MGFECSIHSANGLTTHPLFWQCDPHNCTSFAGWSPPHICGTTCYFWREVNISLVSCGLFFHLRNKSYISRLILFFARFSPLLQTFDFGNFFSLSTRPRKKSGSRKCGERRILVALTHCRKGNYFIYFRNRESGRGSDFEQCAGRWEIAFNIHH